MFGMALVVGTLVNFAIAPSGNVLLLILGLVSGLAAVCGVAFVEVQKQNKNNLHTEHGQHQAKSPQQGDCQRRAHDALEEVEVAVSSSEAIVSNTVSSQDASVELQKASCAENGITAEVSIVRKMVVTVTSGCLMSLWSPLTTLAVSADVQGIGVPLTSYGEYVCFCLSILLSTLLFIPLITRFPLEGGASKSVKQMISSLMTAPIGARILCIIAGAIWSVGGIANIIGATSEELSPATSYGIGQAAPLMAIFWGLFLFHEFEGTSVKVKISLLVVVVLFVGAIASFYVSQVLDK